MIDADFPIAPFESLGYHLYISGQKSYNGVAIFSKQAMTEVSAGFTPVIGEVLAEEFDEQKRVITGIINDIRIINLYVPNGSSVGSDKYQYKLRWLATLREYLAKILLSGSREICVCGDFNIALADIDIYDPKKRPDPIMYSPAEREALRKVLELGLRDAFRKFTAEGGHYSWWDYRSGGFDRNRGWRIDHLYLTPNLYDRAIDCTIDREPRKQEKPSDHTPVIVEL